MYDSIKFASNPFKKHKIEFEFRDKKVSYDLMTANWQTKCLECELSIFKIENDNEGYLRLYEHEFYEKDDNLYKVYNGSEHGQFYEYTHIDLDGKEPGWISGHGSEHNKSLIKIEILCNMAIAMGHIVYLDGEATFKFWNDHLVNRYAALEEPGDNEIIHQEIIEFLPLKLPQFYIDMREMLKNNRLPTS